MAHPIETIMRTTMENLKDMIDVDTVVGSPVSTGDGLTIVPVSRVSFGFVAGGGEYTVGGTPVGGGQVRLLPALNNTSIDRLIEMIPQILDDIKGMLPCKKENRIPV